MKMMIGPDVLQAFQQRIMLLNRSHGGWRAVLLHWLPEQGDAPWTHDLSRMTQHIADVLGPPYDTAMMIALPAGDILVLGDTITVADCQQISATMMDAATSYGGAEQDMSCHTYDLNSDWDAFLKLCRAIYARTSSVPGTGGETPQQLALLQHMDTELTLHKPLFVERDIHDKLDLLVVEDEPSIRQLLGTLLGATSYNITFAADGQEAVQAYCRRPPHMVFLDIGLPDVSGLKLLELFKRHDAHMYAVMLTSHADSSRVQMAMKQGVKNYVVKPFSRNKLNECIERYLTEGYCA